MKAFKEQCSSHATYAATFFAKTVSYGRKLFIEFAAAVKNIIISLFYHNCNSVPNLSRFFCKNFQHMERNKVLLKHLTHRTF